MPKFSVVRTTTTIRSTSRLLLSLSPVYPALLARTPYHSHSLSPPSLSLSSFSLPFFLPSPSLILRSVLREAAERSIPFLDPILHRFRPSAILHPPLSAILSPFAPFTSLRRSVAPSSIYPPFPPSFLHPTVFTLVTRRPLARVLTCYA